MDIPCYWASSSCSLSRPFLLTAQNASLSLLRMLRSLSVWHQLMNERCDGEGEKRARVNTV